MEKKEILEAFKQAEIDWSKNNLDSSFCFYFVLSQNLSFRNQVEKFLQPLWFKYRTVKNSAFHFNNRQERLKAIRKVINELEKE